MRVLQSWNEAFGWWFKQPACVHMLSENASESGHVHGMFNFDQGYPSP